jgi:pilus assembly protein CpaE
LEGEPAVDKIRVLIASNNQSYRESLAFNLSQEGDLHIIGEVPDSASALKKTEQLLPDIVVIEVEQPSGDGITATEKITLAHPEVGVVVIGAQADSESFRKAMMAGARDYLVKEQVNPHEIAEAVRRIFLTEKTRLASYASVRMADKQNKNKIPQIVTVFGAKGGAGKTTMAVNLAVMIAQETKKRVALIDLDLQFGDVTVYLNLKPRRTLAELVQERTHWDIQLLNNYLIPHSSGIKVMSSPLRPEDADLIVPEHIEKILSILRQNFDYIIVDSPPYFSDTILTALDMSTQILLLMSMDLPSVKNLKLSLNLLDSLHHSGKTKLVINRSSMNFGIDIRDVEKTIDFLTAEEVPSDGQTVVGAANKGMPFVISHPQTEVSKAVHRVARIIIEDYGYQRDLRERKPKGSFWSRLFG